MFERNRSCSPSGLSEELFDLLLVDRTHLIIVEKIRDRGFVAT